MTVKNRFLMPFFKNTTYKLFNVHSSPQREKGDKLGDKFYKANEV